MRSLFLVDSFFVFFGYRRIYWIGPFLVIKGLIEIPTSKTSRSYRIRKSLSLSLETENASSFLKRSPSMITGVSADIDTRSRSIDYFL